MIRRGGRTIRPAQNPDGTLRVVPGQNQAEDAGGSPQEAPSSLSAAGSPPSQAQQAAVDDLYLPNLVATSTDPPSSPMPVFEDMGQFLKEFATKRGDVPQNNIFDGQTAELEPLPPRLP
ncbi:hypothetical protein FRC09_020394 [Ceratobasidium sp. 395]|nr:hypothetical protein FRC09_020394 [Ceratobasidium sp. 395]